jgi:hypothetical protein
LRYIFHEKLYISSKMFRRSGVLILFIIEERRYYISKGYPGWHPSEWGESTKHWDWASIDEAREKSWKVIEPDWNKFIEQLKKEGRYRE